MLIRIQASSLIGQLVPLHPFLLPLLEQLSFLQFSFPDSFELPGHKRKDGYSFSLKTVLNAFGTAVEHLETKDSLAGLEKNTHKKERILVPIEECGVAA